MVESISSSHSNSKDDILYHPFQDGHQLGLGVSIGIDKIHLRSCPFPNTDDPINFPKGSPIQKDITKTYMLRNISDYSKEIKANAGFSWSGWGPQI